MSHNTTFRVSEFSEFFGIFRTHSGPDVDDFTYPAGTLLLSSFIASVTHTRM